MKTVYDFVGASLMHMLFEANTVQLVTDRGVINLHNEFLSPLPATDPVGVTVTGLVIAEGESITIRLSDGQEIRMSLADQDYRGPEAAEFYFESGEIIVFN